MTSVCSDAAFVKAKAPAKTKENLTALARVELAVVAAFDAVLDKMERRRATQMLRGLDDRMLKDIGVSRSDVAQIAQRKRH